MYRIIFFTLLLSFSFSLSAQDCEPYIPQSEGSTWTIGNFNAKGKLEGRTHFELKSIESNGTKTTFVIYMKVEDQKGKEQFESEYTAECEKGKFSIDMLFKLNQQITDSFKNMEIDVDASEFYLPQFNETVGTELPDSYMNIQASSNGTPIMKINFQIKDRKIDSKEEYTTSAGTFDCIVLSQSFQMKLIIAVNGSTKEWYAKDVGMVRSESYNKNGKLQGYSELVELNRK